MNLKDMLKQEEGFSGRPYKDTLGFSTIGYGRNLDVRGISEAEAETMLENDICWANNQLFSCYPWLKALDDPRKYVLISMVFNMGIGKFRDFDKMLSALKRTDFETASKEMLNSEWAKQTKSRAVKLAEIMRTGI